MLNNLPPLDDNEDDPIRLWAEIIGLRAAVKGPDGFATWQDAATDERIKRVKAQNTIEELTGHLVRIMDVSWVYVHGWCTIRSSFKVWDRAREYLSTPLGK